MRLIPFRSGPVVLLSLAAFVSLVWCTTAVYEVTHQPTSGITFRSYEITGGALVVESTSVKGLAPGDIITAVEGSDGTWRTIDADTTLRMWDYPVWANDLAAFLALNGELQALLSRQGMLHLRLDRGAVVTVPAIRFSVLSLPLDFWFTTVAAHLAWLLAVAVKVFRPRYVGVNHLLLFGLGVCLAFSAMATGYNMSLPIPVAADRIGGVMAINLVGLWLGTIAGLGLFLTFPARLVSPATVAALYAACAALFGLAQLRPGGYAAEFLLQQAASVIWMGAIPLTLWAQWRRCNSPTDRSAIRWLALVFGIGIVTVYLLMIVPNYLRSPGLSTSLAPLFVLAVFGGVAVGIARYRLFDLDTWWFSALLWATGGAVVLLLDALFMWWMEPGGALFFALAIGGWVYFPLRQWFWKRLHPAATKTLEHYLPDFIDTLFASHSDRELSRRWVSLLERVYSPLTIRTESRALSVPSIAEDGMVLRAPALDGVTALTLVGRNKGARLFDSTDVDIASALLALARHAASLERSNCEIARAEQQRAREKELLLRELHDGLGGLTTNIALLADMARQGGCADTREALNNIASLSREAVYEIRGFMQTVDSSDTDWQIFAADLRHWGSHFLAPHSIELEFRTSARRELAPPPTTIVLNLFRIYREALSNVVKHAHASHVIVKLEVGPNMIRLVVADNGRPGFAGLPSDVMLNGGRGLENMRKRAEELGGRLSVTQEEPVEIVVEVPWQGSTGLVPAAITHEHVD